MSIEFLLTALIVILLPGTGVIYTVSIGLLHDWLLLSGTFMAMTLVVFVVYGAAAHGLRRCLIDEPRRMRWLQRGFAALFALLGARLAMAER